MTASQLKQHLAAVFDDNLHTRKWHNMVDYLIIAMIIISTLEIFLSTFNLDPRLRRVLFWVDIATLVFFTIEVSLRIWVAPAVDPRYKGWRGRLRYCFTFHGFLDIVSTYPYYLQWLMPFPIAWVKVLRISRVTRLFRVSRYMKSWRLLTDSIREKRHELLISMQFLLIITFALSLILYFCEHDVQPEAYDNGGTSVAWAFAQYIGDPGGFGDTPPVTVAGRIIACIVGLLGIAIVAVPAGILGAGFTEAIEKENNKEQLEADGNKLRLGFAPKLDRPSGLRVTPPYRTLPHLQARYGMTQDEIINAVNNTPGFRLINLADTRTVDSHAIDMLAVESFKSNRSYGLLIDRGSAFTIISPTSFIDPAIGFFAYNLAEIGGFNYISREFGERTPYRSYYLTPQDGEPEPGETEYFADLKTLLDRSQYSLTVLAASGANEPEYDTQIHFNTGTAKGDEATGNLVADKEAYTEFYEHVIRDLTLENIATDNGRHHDGSSSRLFLRKLGMEGKGTNPIMRIAWSASLWSPNRLRIAQILAQNINTLCRNAKI